ncbi:MAG: hypothetical protein Q9162_007982, partial [Coniocarpon cinnabarinum]
MEQWRPFAGSHSHRELEVWLEESTAEEYEEGGDAQRQEIVDDLMDMASTELEEIAGTAWLTEIVAL